MCLSEAKRGGRRAFSRMYREEKNLCQLYFIKKKKKKFMAFSVFNDSVINVYLLFPRS